MKRRSNPRMFREINANDTAVAFYFTPIRLAKIRKLANDEFGGECEKKGTPLTLLVGGSVAGVVSWGSSWQC